MTAKPEGWEEELKNSINEGKNFAETNKTLFTIYGKDGKVAKATYQRHKKDLTGGADVDNDLKALGEKIKETKPKGPPRPKWTPQKQGAADKSKLAELLNKGIYQGVMPFCKSKKLKEEDVQDINLGGAVVATIQWAAPGLNLDHPIIVLVTRGIMFYLTFKRICTLIQQKVDGVREKLAGVVESGATEGMAGVKPEFAALVNE